MVTPHLHTNQYAYLQGLSTTDALVNMLHNWLESMDQTTTSHVHVIMKDFSNAFDKLQPSILLDKMTSMNIHPGAMDNSSEFSD